VQHLQLESIELSFTLLKSSQKLEGIDRALMGFSLKSHA
jgi:hypothetical protein